MAAVGKRMAAKQPAKGQIRSSGQTVAPQRLKGVFAAGRKVAAADGQIGRNGQLVEPDKPLEHMGYDNSEKLDNVSLFHCDSPDGVELSWLRVWRR